MRRSLHPRPIVGIGALLVVIAFVACGSGGSVTSVPQNNSGATASQVSATTSTTGSVTMPTAVAAGISSSVQLPAASANVAITETVSGSVPSGIPALSTARAAALAASRVTQGARTVQATSSPSPLLYVQFTSATSVTLDGTPGVVFTLPSITAGASYYVAAYESGSWVAPAEGPGTVSGSTVTFPLSTTGTTTISPSSPATVALYLVTAATSSPSPIPSASPSPSPVPSVAPASLTFDATAPTTAPFTVSEAGDTAPFTAVITCATPAPSPSPSASPGGIVLTSPSPSPSSSPLAYPFVAQFPTGATTTTATPSAGTATFSVVSGNEVGTCSIVVTDVNGATATETVDVDATVLGLYATHRKSR